MIRDPVDSCEEQWHVPCTMFNHRRRVVVETLSCMRLRSAAQQLRLVAKSKRRRARNHHFVATLYEAAARTLPMERAANAEPFGESAQTRDGPS